MVEETFTLANSLGLHARPAAEITKMVSKYKSKVLLRGNNKTVDAKSAIMVMTMGVARGGQLTITVDGEDEALCMAALKEFVVNKFYEE